MPSTQPEGELQAGPGNLGASACRLFKSVSTSEIPGERRRRKPRRPGVKLAQTRVETEILPS